jgi:hypothetical protein
MTTLRRLSLTAAASLAALGLSTASAAIVAVDQNGNPIGSPVTGGDGITAGATFDAGTLNVGGAINVEEDDLTDGQQIDELIEFMIGEGVAGANTAFAVEFGAGRPTGPAGIENFVVDLLVNGTIVQTLNVTNAIGRIDFDAAGFTLAGLNPGDVVGLALSGSVYETFGADANYSINVTANAVPLPAAGLLFGTAALGGALARRKRKTA